MKIATSLAALCCLSPTLASAQAIRLDSSIMGPPAAEMQMAYTGGCGGAMVTVLGIRNFGVEIFTVDSDGGDLIIARATSGAPKKISLKQRLKDHNGLACLGNGREARLVLWAACGGSSCGGDFYNFTVVDPYVPRVVSPEDGCDYACASALTNNLIPAHLGVNG